MSERPTIATKSDQGSPLVARIILIAIMLSLFGAYVADVYYR